MDTTKTTTHLGLCAGYGGIELGLKRIIPTLRSVALCEIEGFAVANLVAKMEAGLMEPAPIWTDLKSFPWESFRDRVDILTGGYPCQPFSAAGKRLGTEDPRHLWPFIASGIRLLRPKLCFFENVEGHISLGLREVIGELESMGYKVSWGIFSAREVGAPHQRKRVFIMAHLKCEGLERLYKWYTPSEQTESFGADSGASCQRSAWEGCELANIQSIGLEKQSECCIKPEASGSGIMDSSGIHSRIPTIPGELANSKLHGCDHSNEKPHADGIQRPLGQEHEHRQAVGNGQLWPSRPGEPQHGWEPPRVVGAIPAKLADFCSRHSQSWGDTAQAGGESSCERREGADAMPHGGSSVCGGNQGDEPEDVANSIRSRGEEPEHLDANLPSKPSGRDSESVGNSESEQSSSRDHRGQQGSTCEQEQVQLGGGDCGALRESNGQAQPPLGGNPDGTSDWLDYAELYTTCDNRTDELRLLGNGVVPATAERAFRTLLNELLTNKTSI